MMATPSSQFRRPEAAGDSRPIAWKQVPLRHCFRIISGATPSTNEPEYWDGDVVWVTPDDLGRADSRSITTSQRRITSLGAASIGQRTVPVKSLVLSTRAPIGHLGIAEVPMTTNQGCKSLAANPGVHAAYAYFQLLSRIDELRSHGTGTTFAELSRAQLARMPFWCPPIRVQQSIADFLDRETERIDALVAKKQLLIELLQEKRTALISHAVTKGLDPDAPMKDSGIEWMGEIPSDWDALPLGRVARSLQTGPFGTQLHSHDYIDDGTPVINPSNLRDGRVVPDWRCSVDEATAHRLDRHRMRAGDILFGRRGEMGRCAVVTPLERGWLCGTGCLRVQLQAALAVPAFFVLQLGTNRVGDWLLLESVGSTMDNLNTSVVSRIPVAVPPVVMQSHIVSILAVRMAGLDALVTRVWGAIARLREYRSALITAAVTGQIDVDTR